MKPITAFFLSSFASVLFAGTVAAQPAKPTNLLIITADDMNADSSGWMGNKLWATPNLDAFAGTAHRFVNHHVTVPICQPGRSALMTGQVPHRNGALGFNPINPDVPTLVEVLGEAGYFTAAVNKTAHMAPRAKFPWNLSLEGSGKTPKQFGQHVAQCLKAAADAKKPFFLNANITDPHRPFPGGFQGKKKAKRPNTSPVEPYDPADVTVPSFLEDLPEVRLEVSEYFAGVRRFDRSFGELMAALKAAGREGDTLIVFLSDHGMSFPFSKATVYFNGTRSPLLIRWPGMPVAKTHEEFISSVDVVPTLLELLGVKAPAGLDGRTLAPLLRGQKQPDRDFVITHVNTVSSGRDFSQRCVRTKTRSLMFHAWSDGQARFRVEAMSGRSFAATAAAGKIDPRIQARVDQLLAPAPLALYDLEKDPGERVNLIADPAYRKDVEELSKRLLAHMDRTGDPRAAAFRQALGKLK